MLQRAVARGEMPAAIDQEVVLDLFVGAAYHRLLQGHLPRTELADAGRARSASILPVG
jgi:tetracycline repressor-like protein